MKSLVIRPTLVSPSEKAWLPERGLLPGERNLTLDALKGLLVLLMVLYHWLNYFVPAAEGIYRYLRFITPSFIFITGFLIAQLYLTTGAGRAPGPSRRLLVRSAKLLALFTVLNFVGNLAFKANYDGTALGLSRFFANAPSIYLAGNGRGAAFEILLPIAYLLAVASLLVRAGSACKRLVPLAWVSGLACVYVLKWEHWGSSNVELLTMGLLGMLAGRLAPATVTRAIRPTAAWCGAYAIYLVALAAYDAVYALQVVGLILNVVLLYMLAKGLGDTNEVARQVVVLGQYSLLAYITHIAILQILARTLRPFDPSAGTCLLSLAATLLLTVLVVTATAWLRARSPVLDRFYRLVLA